MALSDPELDLLRELLIDEPTHGVFLQVGEEFVRRGEWLDARGILAAGLTEHADKHDGWAGLARACLELGEPMAALDALAKIDTDPAVFVERARVRILAVERAGQKDQAATLAEVFLAVHPGDVVIESVVERLEAPEHPQAVHAADPLITLERAQRYVAIGRPDRAIRVLRRVLFQRPGERGAEGLLRQLQGTDDRMFTDDLSEEIIGPASLPASLDMPAPRLGKVLADEELYEPRNMTSAIEAFARGEGAHPLPEDFSDESLSESSATLSDEDGEPRPQASEKPEKRRRRRSLLKH
ncbi:MAG: hypothetical protein GWP91_25960 [Rhodobacterales bacterium]|nr:hypothetical protein [Rhodobacterales bacterium]